MNNHRKFLLKNAGILVSLFLISACALKQDYALLHDMIRGDECYKAVTYIQKSQEQYGSKDRLLFLLDSAIINMQCKDYGTANNFFHQAEALAEQLWTESISKNLTAMITNDLVLPYDGEDFERVLINLLSAICYLELNQKEEAFVECRKMDTLLSLYNNKYQEKKNAYREDAFARYLSGIIYESDNKMDDAYIDYLKAFKIFEDYREDYGTEIPDILKEDLCRLASVTDRADEIEMLIQDCGESEIMKQTWAEKKGKLVIIHLNGLAPVKIDRRFVVPTQNGNLSIAFPEYKLRSSGTENSRFIISSENRESIEAKTFLAEDINQIAIKSLSDRKQRIWAKAVARAAVKQVAINTITGGEGFFTSLLNTINNIAVEKADTRAWLTLPAKIYMAREFLEPGKYYIDMQNSDKNREFRKEINIKQGGTEYLVVYTIY
jgi:uncharacterized protein